MRSYTPLRYPGGKVRLYNFSKDLISDNFQTPPIYSEAFAGGAGLALKLLSKGIVSQIHINDYDYAIYSFWYSMKRHNKKLKKMMLGATFSIEEWDRQKKIYLTSSKGSKSPYSKLEIGFATFYLNRTNRSGILSAGPIGGRKQNGNYLMDCRFNKKALAEIFDNFYEHRFNIYVYHCDAYKFIKNMDENFNNQVIYLDPPYVQKGPGLYKNSFDENKHTELRDSMREIRSKWFMTYDEDKLVKNLYENYESQIFNLNYSAHSSKKGSEYAIFSDNMIVNDDIKKI